MTKKPAEASDADAPQNELPELESELETPEESVTSGSDIKTAVEDDAAPEPGLETEPETKAEPAAADKRDKPPKPGKVKLPWSKRKKLLVFGLTPLAVLLVLALIAILPVSYPLWSFVHKPVTLNVNDSDYKSPLDNLDISLDGQKLTFKGKQPYSFKTAPGRHRLIVAKQYYATSNTSFTVKPFGGGQLHFDVNLKPTGRPVVVQVQNTITKAPLASAKITLDKATTETDKDGKARLIVPAGNDTVDIKVSKSGYYDAAQKVTIAVSADKTKVDPKNVFNLVPTGKIYFLSKRTGRIDVMKSNLDGSGQTVVMPGTGRENDTDTILLASRDWKYLVLKSIRDSDKPKLYLIDTSNNDKVTTFDEGDANFTLTGWQDHTFVYTVIRNVEKQSDHYRLKAYNAESNSIKILDKTVYQTYPGSGYTAFGYWSYNWYSDETIDYVTLIGKQVVYTKVVQGAADPTRLLTHKIMTVNTDGSGLKAIHEIDYRISGGYYGLRLLSPYEILANTSVKNGNSYDQKYYVYNEEAGKLTELTDKTLIGKYGQSPVITYLYSPSNKKTFWSEPRDGKNTLFIGNDEGEDGDEIASGSEYDTYGWYTDSYLLLSKKGSELYIAGPDAKNPVKITDYHKPAFQFSGYGGGYGGR